MDAIARLLRPRSVAVIGASADAGKTAGRPVAYLRKHGFAGQIYPVNPRADSIGDLRCYPDIASLPATPDVGIVLLGPERAHLAVRELAATGCAAAIVLASGYAETGEVGLRRQQQLRDAAGGMRLLGPNTIGLVNLTDSVMLSASGALEMEGLRAGGIAVVSQSGGILGSLLSRASATGIGFSKLVSTSNEVDLDLADFVDHLVDDEATSVIALYMEGLRDPRKFVAAAMRAARAGKPVVVYKVGRSESGARSVVSHTGAMAGADRMYDALFLQAGVIRATRFSDLLDIPAALATRRALRGKRVAILTSTGGAGTLVADSLGLAGFETPAPGEVTAARLRALQQDDQAVLDRNPIDVTLAGLQPDLLRGAIDALLSSPDYDAVITVVGSSALARPELASGAIADSLATTDKPLLAYVSPHAPAVVSLLNGLGAPAFTAPESCAVALSAMAARDAWQAPEAPPAAAGTDARDATGIAASGSLDEARARALFARFGVPSVREQIVATPAQGEAAAAGFAGPVVLKVLSSRITHKSDVGGVAVGVVPADVGARLVRMNEEVTRASGVAPDGFLVQEMVTGGVELILGFHRDPQLGPALLLGMGGVTAELFQDTTMRLLPVGPVEAQAMVRALKTWPLLDGYRGRPRADVAALVDAIVAFSRMAMALGDRLLEAEINPLFVLPAGEGVRAADGVAVLR